MAKTNLPQERRRAGLTQAQLAERAGIARTTIGKLEAGTQLPQPSTVERLAEALGIDPRRLRFEHVRQPPVSNGQPSDSGGVAHVNGSVIIHLDEYMTAEVQEALFLGSARAWLTEPE